jgi:hypothetical protein
LDALRKRGDDLNSPPPPVSRRPPTFHYSRDELVSYKKSPLALKAPSCDFPEDIGRDNWKTIKIELNQKERSNVWKTLIEDSYLLRDVINDTIAEFPGKALLIRVMCEMSLPTYGLEKCILGDFSIRNLVEFIERHPNLYTIKDWVVLKVDEECNPIGAPAFQCVEEREKEKDELEAIAWLMKLAMKRKKKTSDLDISL